MIHSIDYVIIIVYLIAVAVVGIVMGGKQKSAKDYFLGADSVPWWAVCFSIVAAETSSLTFISIPGLAYLTNLNFLQVAFGYLIGRIIVAYYFLPHYYKGELSTAYAFLETRFGKKTRSLASLVFIFTRTAADGVRLFATAIPLKLMLDIDYPVAIIVIAIVALAYTYIGGVKGIIWVDVIQMFIYLGGAGIACYFLLNNFLANGLTGVLEGNSEKFSLINFGFEGGLTGFFKNPYTLIGGVLGGAFLSMASHGTDQMIVQRLLTTKSLAKSRKAIIGSGIIIIIQFALFLFVGILLYSFYGTLNLSQLNLTRADEIFPKFIIQSLPPGVSGLIIAGLFAAALSTLAGSISSLSSSTMMDLYKPFSKVENEKKDLLISRVITVIWAVLLISAAILFMNSPQSVVELALSIASFTYGGLLGTFLLGIFVKDATQEDALAGFIAGILFMITVISLNLTAWTWFTLIGVIVTVSVGKLLTVIVPRKNIGNEK